MNYFVKFIITSFIMLGAGQAIAFDSAASKDLIYYTAFGRSEDIKIILGRGANPDARNQHGLPALAIASDRKDPESLKLAQTLVEAGADINLSDGDKNYPLLNAVKNRNVALVKYYLSKEADFNITDNKGNTPYQVAKVMDFPEIAGLILDKIREIEERNRQRASPENFMKLVRSVAFNSCAAKYNMYILDKNLYRSEQDKSFRNNQVNQHKDQIKVDAQELAEVFRYNQQQINDITTMSSSTLANKLDYMGERRTRPDFGNKEQITERCMEVVKNWKFGKGAAAAKSRPATSIPSTSAPSTSIPSTVPFKPRVIDKDDDEYEEE